MCLYTCLQVTFAIAQNQTLFQSVKILKTVFKIFSMAQLCVQAILSPSLKMELPVLTL